MAMEERATRVTLLEPTIDRLTPPENGFVTIVSLVGLLYREVLADHADQTLPVPGTKLRLVQELAGTSGLDAVHVKGHVLLFFLDDETWVIEMLDALALKRTEKVNGITKLPEARRVALLDEVSRFKAAALGFLRELRGRLAAAPSQPSALVLSALPPAETLRGLLQAAIFRRMDHDEDLQGAARGHFEEGVAVAWAQAQWPAPEFQVLPSCVVVAAKPPAPAQVPALGPGAPAPQGEAGGSPQLPCAVENNNAVEAATKAPAAPGGKCSGEKTPLLCTKQEFDALVIDNHDVLHTILEVKAGAALYQDLPKAMGALANFFQPAAHIQVKGRKGKPEATKVVVSSNLRLVYFFGASGTLQELLQISSTQTELGVMLRSQVLLDGCVGQLGEIRGAKVHVNFHESVVSQSQARLDVFCERLSALIAKQTISFYGPL